MGLAPADDDDSPEARAVRSEARERAEAAIALLPDDFRVPLGKAAIRRPGSDLTIVTWGRCTLFCHKAVAELTAAGIDVELIDLRTIVPPDMETVLASVAKTGRLLVVHEDRVFSSIGREIQGAVIEAMAGEPVVTRVLGQDPVPGIPQNIHLEEKIVVSPEKVVAAAHEVLGVRPAGGAAAKASAGPARSSILWTPNRYFVA